MAGWAVDRVDEMRRWLTLFAPEWSSFAIKPYAKYLGFILGPSAGIMTWVRPLEKFRERAKHIGSSHAPPAVAVEQWNVYVSSVLPYWGQLTCPPRLKVHEESNMMNSALLELTE